MTAHVDKGKQIRFVLPDPASPKFDPNEMTKRYQPLISDLAEAVLSHAVKGDVLGVIWLQECLKFIFNAANGAISGSKGA